MDRMMKNGFIILSHQGLSQVGPLAEEINRRGYQACVLSSKSSRGLQPDWLNKVEIVSFTDGYSLNKHDVDVFVSSLSNDIKLVGCISVWDGYRSIMAYANKVLRANDIDVEIVDLLRDKLLMRKTLMQNGLSRKNVFILDQELFDQLTNLHHYFIKPRVGLASFGAFRADRIVSYDELEPLRQLACSDAAYCGVFDEDMQFIIEDYINGIECSFEVSVGIAGVAVHAIHEKVDLQSHSRTTLENACVCPPISLSEKECADGVDFVSRCLIALGIDTGVYHIEARYHSDDGWEIIEINPRIGGAYIVDSTRLHSNADLLSYWVGLIVGDDISFDSEKHRKTFFRVFFGEKGRTINRLTRNETGLPVLMDKLFINEGEHLPDVEREIFVGQALWDITSLSCSAVKSFISASETHFIVEYRT
ncbi:ATP-grasp domain-containing protein [Paludibacterium yongneupense]|uniref:ATP-grasp domain-containing protein n=1 Tax=Paludibacterium yongneupense TaxID=400061 RepID=UPI001FE9FF84|nr:ATP-grasp domain-containing protein [Paludibacterium yongneupense]